MELPSITASSESHLNYAAHVEGACEAWKDAEIITPEQQTSVTEIGAMIRTAADELRAREMAAEEADRATSRARARFGVRDVILDLSVMATRDGVLNGPANRSQEHPIFKQVFRGTSPTAIVRTSMRQEPEVVGRMRDRLAATSDFPAKAGLISGLDATIAGSIGARDALQQADDAGKKAWDDELAARHGLRHTIEKAYGLLRAAFPGQRDFVESFFPKRESAAKPPAEAPAPVAEPAPADAPASGIS